MLSLSTLNDILYGFADLNEKQNKLLFEIVHHNIIATKRFDMIIYVERAVCKSISTTNNLRTIPTHLVLLSQKS